MIYTITLHPHCTHHIILPDKSIPSSPKFSPTVFTRTQRSTACTTSRQHNHKPTSRASHQQDSTCYTPLVTISYHTHSQPHLHQNQIPSTTTELSTKRSPTTRSIPRTCLCQSLGEHHSPYYHPIISRSTFPMSYL